MHWSCLPNQSSLLQATTVTKNWSKIVSDRSTSASIMKRESCSQLYDVEQDSRFGRHVGDGAK
jgi:hypothetical protein